MGRRKVDRIQSWKLAMRANNKLTNQSLSPIASFTFHPPPSSPRHENTRVTRMDALQVTLLTGPSSIEFPSVELIARRATVF